MLEPPEAFWCSCRTISTFKLSIWKRIVVYQPLICLPIIIKYLRFLDNLLISLFLTIGVLWWTSWKIISYFVLNKLLLYFISVVFVSYFYIIIILFVLVIVLKCCYYCKRLSLSLCTTFMIVFHIYNEPDLRASFSEGRNINGDLATPVP